MFLCYKSRRQTAFTLIELSIVLVIIGLLVGGALVGRDLIRAAEVRAQIAQIEKYQQAVNTFRGKYAALPGDIGALEAYAIGLATRGCAGRAAGLDGAGDANGIIEGVADVNSPNTNCSTCVAAGEPVFFWNDLTYANGKQFNLIDGRFVVNENIGPGGNAAVTVSGTPLNNWYPRSKLGDNFIYVYSQNSANWFGMSRITSLLYSTIYSSAGVTVGQAYNIDKKIDDGLPQTGSVQAMYVNNSVLTRAGTADQSATAAGATTCYDNNNAAGTAQQYSITQNNGSGLNCALSFRFQ